MADLNRFTAAGLIALTDGISLVGSLLTAAPVGTEAALIVRNLPSGTQTVIGLMTVAALGTQTVAGPTTTGTSYSTNNPVVIGGVDTSNTVRPFITTATGQQVVIGTITVGPTTQTITASSGTQTVIASGTGFTVTPSGGTFAVSTLSDANLLPLPMTVVAQTSTFTVNGIGTYQSAVVVIQPNTTWSATTTLAFEASGDGNSFYSLPVTPLGGATTSLVTIATGTGTLVASYMMNVGGQQIIRVRVASLQAGDNVQVYYRLSNSKNTIYLQSSIPTGSNVIGAVTQSGSWTVSTGPVTQTITGSFSSATNQTISGVTTTGVSFGANNPVVIGGVDTSNTVRPFITTATGQQVFIGTITVGPTTQTITASTGTMSVAQGSTWTVAVGPATQTVGTGPATQTITASTGTMSVAQGSTWTVAVGPATQTVGTGPATQTITASTGTMSVAQGSTWTVATGPGTQTVAGSVTANAAGLHTVAGVTSTGVSFSTSNPVVIGGVDASNTVRPIITSATGQVNVIGTITVGPATQTITGSFSAAAVQTVSGLTTTGASFGANNPVVIGGVDASNTVRPIVTTATGQQIIIGTITVGPATQTITGSFSAAAVQTVSGLTTTGTSFGANNPIIIGGVDSSNTVRPIVTTTTGAINVSITNTVAALLTTSPTGTEIGVVVRNVPSGTQTITQGSTWTVASGPAVQTVSGQTTTGASFGANNPIIIGGVDSSNTVRPLVTTTAGAMNVSITNTAAALLSTTPTGSEIGVVVRNIPSGTQTVSVTNTAAALLTTTPTGSEVGVVVRNIPSGTQTVTGSFSAAATQTVAQGSTWTVAVGPTTQTTLPTGTLTVNPNGMTDALTSTNITGTGVVTTVTTNGGGTFSYNFGLLAGTFTTITFKTEGSFEGVGWIASPHHIMSDGQSMGGAATLSTITTLPINVVACANGFRQIRINVTVLTLAGSSTLLARSTYQVSPFVLRQPAVASPARLSLSTTSDTTIVSSPGAGLSLYIVGLTGTNAGTAAVQADVKEGSGGTIRFTYYMAAQGGGFVRDFVQPWKLPANTALNVQLGGSQQCYFTATYFIAP